MGLGRKMLQSTLSPSSRNSTSFLLIGCLLLCIYSSTVQAAANSHSPKCIYMGYPDVHYDGVDRTETLTEKTFNRTVDADGALSIVFFSDVEADDPELDQYECFLQLTAQFMEKRGYKFYTVNTTKELKLRKQEDVSKGEDTIHVYKDGYQIEYHGIRDPSTFLSWVLDIPDEALTIINSKEDKRDFEELADETTRVIGWFEPGSKELTEFEEAAEDFMGEVEFFAVVDKFWAKKFGLQEVGDVLMFRPYEEEPLEAPDTHDTEEEFEQWVEENKDPVLQKLSEYNYFDVWVDPEEDEFLIVAFADDEEPQGRALFKLLKKVANKFSEKAGELEIVLIDPEEFPLMIDVWENSFGIEIETEPQIGLVDISEHEGIWLDMSLLNLEDSKKYEDENQEVLVRWIEQILNGQIALEGVIHDSTYMNQKVKANLPKKTTLKSKSTGNKILKNGRFKKSKNQMSAFDKRSQSTCDCSILQNQLEQLQAKVLKLESLLRNAATRNQEQTVPYSLQSLDGHGQKLTANNYYKTSTNKHAKLVESVSSLDKSSNKSQYVEVNLDNSKLPSSSRKHQNSSNGIVAPTSAPSTAAQKSQQQTTNKEKTTLFRIRRQLQSNANEDSLLPERNPRHMRSLRRCRRKQIEKCNIIERHILLNPMLMYFVCAALVCMARAMRIHVSFYICPVIDDWRDYLRQKLPPAVHRVIRI